jgi:hypothetical protein
MAVNPSNAQKTPRKRRKAPATPPPKPRGPRVAQWAEEGRRLAALLTKRGIGKTAFGEQIGRKFHTVHRWCLGFEFGPDNQRTAANALNEPPDVFEDPSSAVRRARHTRAVLEEFRATRPVANKLSAADWSVLRSIRFHADGLRPTVAFYEAVALALIHAIPVDEIMRVAADNSAIDATLAHKPPLKRRPP